jgi:hypothetical protein
MPRSSCRNRHIRRSPTAVLGLLIPFDLPGLASASASIRRRDRSCPPAGQVGGGWSVFWSSFPGA